MTTPTAATLSTALEGRYRVERELGAGGMATVYLAHDLKHDRDVAIKVLHPELGAALGGERFLSEIKTTARLQHPHILPLLDSGDAGGLLYYVMPLAIGETLRARLSREKQLPIADALNIAREVADALSHAHTLGIIHRDIKPENILLQGGHALVADFGIALAVQSAGGERMTQTGLSLGTPQYMSPEQAMGDRAIDARADIYALGAVTYEMLAGDPPFMGSTVQAIVAKVMTEKPSPPSAVRDTVTPAVEQAVLRALAKLPADRWATANAFAVALVAPDVASPVSAARRRVPSRILTVAQAVVTVAAIGAALWFARRPRADVRPRGPIRFSVDAGSAEHFNVLGSQPVAISPDGQMIAYVGSGVERRIWVRSLNDAVPRQVAGTSNATTPFFSPDGKWIAYFVGGTVLASGSLVKVPVDGGPVVEITKNVQGLGGVWLPDGRIVLGTQEHTGGLSIVSASGGTPARIVDEKIPGDLGIHRWPRLLPDGETVLFTSWNARVSSSRIAITSMRTHRTKILDIVGGIPLTVVDGFLLYMQASGTVAAIAFDSRSWTTSGEPISVLEGASLDGQGAVRIAISTRGDIVYATGADQLQLVIVDAQGKATPVLSKPGVYSNPRFSPDGRKIAFDIATPTSDIWVYDRASRTLDRITNTGAADRPEWMPDGKRIFFRLSKPGMTALYSTSMSGGGTVDSMQAFGPGIHEGTIGPDGRTLVFRTAEPGGGRDIWSVHLGTGETPKAVLATPFQEMQPRLTTDGQWLAYASDESGLLEIYVRPFPGDGGRVRISADGGTEPVWSPDGSRLFYRSGDRTMVAYVTRTPQLAVTKREVAFEGEYIVSTPHANYDVGLGAREFVMVAPASGGTHMVMVLNWFDEVRARLASRGKAP